MGKHKISFNVRFCTKKLMQLLLTSQNLSVIKSLLFSIFDTFLEIQIMRFY